MPWWPGWPGRHLLESRSPSWWTPSAHRWPRWWSTWWRDWVFIIMIMIIANKFNFLDPWEPSNFFIWKVSNQAENPEDCITRLTAAWPEIAGNTKWKFKTPNYKLYIYREIFSLAFPKDIQFWKVNLKLATLNWNWADPVWPDLAFAPNYQKTNCLFENAAYQIKPNTRFDLPKISRWKCCLWCARLLCSKVFFIFKHLVVTLWGTALISFNFGLFLFKYFWMFWLSN